MNRICPQFIRENAFRLYGVYANASQKEIESKKKMFNSHLNSAECIPAQPSDFDNLLSPIERTMDTIRCAESKLSVHRDKIIQSLFWFISYDESDQQCLQLLAENRMDTALISWESASTANALHNSMVCHFIMGEYSKGLLLAHKLFSNYFTQWKELVSAKPDISEEKVVFWLLDILRTEIPDELASINWDVLPHVWREHTLDDTIIPIIKNIMMHVATCDNSATTNPLERHKDGVLLIENAQPLLKKLESILPADDLTLQRCEDMVYNAALSCVSTCFDASLEKLKVDDEETYRKLLPTCNELVNKIDDQFVSPHLKKSITKLRRYINKCDKTPKIGIEDYIAYSGEFCWCCHSREPNLCAYEYHFDVKTEDELFYYTTHYVNKFGVYICSECEMEINQRERWKVYSFFIVFAFLLLLSAVGVGIAYWIDTGITTIELLSIGGMALLLSVVVSYFMSRVFSWFVRKLFTKKPIRTFRRVPEDHPLYRKAKQEAYRKKRIWESKTYIDL